MDDRLEQLERKVDALSKTVERLEARLAAQGSGTVPTPAAPPATAPETLAKPADPQLLSSALPLVGRTFLVFGGAFLIRAITDRDAVPHQLGVALGLAFATLWVALGWRAASRNQSLSASFHVGSAALIGYPLILETATRLAILSAPTAAVVLTGFSGLMLVTAWRAKHRLTAWLGVGGGVVTAGFLLQRADAPVALTLVLLFLALGSLVLADVNGWTGLRWPVAVVLDFVVLRRVFSTSALPERADQLPSATLLADVTVLLYLAAFAHGTWVRARRVGLFEFVQAALVVAIGVSTAARVEPTLGTVTIVTGCLSLVLAGAAVVTAARSSDRPDRGVDVWFHGLLGLALVLAGGLLLTRGPFVTLLWSACAVASVVVGRRTHTHMLWIFAAVLACAVAVSGGVVTLMADAFVAAPGEPITSSLQTVAVVGVVLGCWLLTAWQAPLPGERGPRVIASALLFLALLGVASLVVLAVRALLGATPEPSLVVLVRTLVLVSGALGLGLASRAGPIELGWISWTSLACAGLKLLAQDLPASRASTLFISFLAFGAAIIVLPRVIRPHNAERRVG